MRILYVTRHFNHSGYAILERLIRERFDIAAVLLHRTEDPWLDRTRGPWLRLWYRFKCWYYRCRPLRTLRSEEQLALDNGLRVIRADSIKDDRFYQDLQALAPDIIVLGGGWHELIPARVFQFPRLGCLNTHPSLLPMFRGTSITRWQVLHGVERSGSTIHYVDDRFDTGGALAQEGIEVSQEWSPQELFHELGKLGADLMVPLLRRFEDEGEQKAYPVEHDERHYRYFKRWTWSQERMAIDWGRTLREIHFFVLSCTQESYEYMGPFFQIGSSRYLLRRTTILPVDPVAEKLSAGRTGLVVVGLDGGRIRLHREGDPHVLVMEQMQRYDRAYKWRRAGLPCQLLRPALGDPFTPSPVLQ